MGTGKRKKPSCWLYFAKGQKNNMVRADLLLDFSMLHLNQCWAPLRNFFFNWFREHVRNISHIAMFTNCWNFSAKTPLPWQTRLCEFTIKIFLGFLSVLIPTDLFKVGTCFLDFLSLPWASTKLSISPCLPSSRTTLRTLLKAGLSGLSTWTVIFGLVTSLLW